jgi:MFS family permease
MGLRGWAGWAADRYGRRPLLLVGGAIFMTAPGAYAAAAGAASLFLVRLAHGAGMGLLPTAATAMVPTSRRPRGARRCSGCSAWRAAWRSRSDRAPA